MNARSIATYLDTGAAAGLLIVVIALAYRVLPVRRRERYRPYHELTRPLRVTPDRTIGAYIHRLRRRLRGAS